MDKLRELRKKKNLTMKQLGAMFGAAESTVSHWENGKREPDTATLLNLADYFNVSVDYLLGREEIKKAPRFKINGRRYSTDIRKYKMGFDKEVRKALLKTPSNDSVLSDIHTSFHPDATRVQFERIYNKYESVITYPVLGTVRAGFNGAIDEIPTGEEIEIPCSMINKAEKNDYFVLQIKGNSMYPKLIDGDKILCKRQTDVDCGDLAVVLYDGEEATVKKVNYDVGRTWIELIPFNPEYAPKRIEGADLEQCRILGKVLKLIRDL